MLAGLKVSSLICKCVYTDQNLMRKGDPMQLNFKGREMKLNNGYTSKSR